MLLNENTRDLHIQNNAYPSLEDKINYFQFNKTDSGEPLPPVLERGAGYDSCPDGFRRDNHSCVRNDMDVRRAYDSDYQNSSFDNHRHRNPSNNDRRDGFHSENERSNPYKIKPHTFDGTYEEWPFFKSLFSEACSPNG